MGTVRIFSIWWFLFIFFIKWQRWYKVLCLIISNHLIFLMERPYYTLKEVLLKFNNLKYTSGSPDFNFSRLCSPKPFKKCFPAVVMHFELFSYQIKILDFIISISLAFAAALIVFCAWKDIIVTGVTFFIS